MPAQRPCVQCGELFDIGPRRGARGRPTNVCSPECREARKREQRARCDREAYAAEKAAGLIPRRGRSGRPPVPCSKCGKPCQTGTGSRPEGERRCRDCGWAKSGEKGKRVSPTPPRICIECGDAAGPRRVYCYACGDSRRRNRYAEKCRRRRALERGVAVEPYSLEEIAARDKFNCGICKTSVDMKLSGLARFGPTIDHVVPLVLGGGDTPANVQLAHRTCNSRKGARVA